MFRKWVAAASLGAVLGLSSYAPASAQQITIRFGFSDPLTTTWGQAAAEFKRLVESQSNDRVRVQLFPSSQLGNIPEMIENVRRGAQEMTLGSPGLFSRFYPRADMLEMPFLVTDWDQVNRLLNSAPFKDLLKAAEQQTQIRIVGNFPYGFRNIINSKRAIKTVDDFKGLKLRTQASPAHLAAFRALGANPVALPIDETYQAVQTGVVDGLENANSMLLANKYAEIAKHVSLTKHLFGMLFIYMNPKFYDGLSEADRALVTKALRDAEAMNLKLSLEAEKNSVEGLRKAGAEVTEVTPENLKAMRTALQKVYDEANAKFGPEFVAMQKAAQP
jgi:tripartite ATP-independent transporter DctP family solute receptor